MGKFNNIISYNNIDVLNEYKITDYSYPLAKVQNNENLLLGSELLYTTLYGSYISLNSKGNIDITTGVNNQEGSENLFINLYAGHVNANTKELIIKNGNEYSDSIINLYGDLIARYSYKIAYEDSNNNEQIFDVIYYHPYINKVFIGSTDKGTDNNKYGTELWIQGRQITINSARDPDTVDSNTTEGIIDIHCYNLKTTSNNKSDFVSSYEMYITSNNSFIQSRAYKNNIIAAYTNARNDQSTICLYGNNAGTWSTSDIGSGNKTGDIYIKATKNLYTSSVDTSITSTGDSKISAGKDLILSSTDDSEIYASKDIYLQSNSKSYAYMYGNKDDSDTFSSTSGVLPNRCKKNTIYIVSHGDIGAYSYNNIETYTMYSTILRSARDVIIEASPLTINSNNININQRNTNNNQYINILNRVRIVSYANRNEEFNSSTENINYDYNPSNNTVTNITKAVNIKNNICENTYVDNGYDSNYILFKKYYIENISYTQTCGINSISYNTILEYNHNSNSDTTHIPDNSIDYHCKYYIENNPTVNSRWNTPNEEDKIKSVDGATHNSLDILSERVVLSNSKHYGTTLPESNLTEGQIFFQIIN